MYWILKSFFGGGRFMEKLERKFYSSGAIEVAKNLLGKYLLHRINGQERLGKIVETEAYMGPEDKAAHSCNNRRTKRTEVMFGPPGYAYVYRIYGMYSCMNVVASERESPQAVLIRALEPVKGLEEMAEARYGKSLSDCAKKDRLGLTNGPGKLCMAMGITDRDSGENLCGNRIFLLKGDREPAFNMVTTTRIHIDYAEEAVLYPYRFYIDGNPYVSVRERKAAREASPSGPVSERRIPARKKP